MRFFLGRLILSSLCFISPVLFAGSFLTQTPEELVEAADGIFVGTLIRSEGILAEDQSIRTRLTYRVDEAILGEFPAEVWVSLPGGIYQGKGHFTSSHVDPTQWKTAILIVVENNYGLSIIPGAYGATPINEDWIQNLETAIGNTSKAPKDFNQYVPTSDFQEAVTDTGFTGSDTVGPRRFQRQDRNDPIPVYYDDSLLPSGLSPQAALEALQNALAAWENATSLRFSIKGSIEFPVTVRDYDQVESESLIIQFHDKFDNIGGSTLGIGGNNFSIDLGSAGTIDGFEFNPINHGYVLLAHDSQSMENPITFEEVLTHEIGHALGLAHSSESQFENNPYLTNAIMYYQAQADGRGATLSDYDVDTILKGYPVDNIPPFAISRKITVLTTFDSFSDSKINRFEIGGGDLDGDSLQIEIIQNSYTQYFDLEDSRRLAYIRTGAFSDGDAGDGAFFSRFAYRLSDGTHKSGWGIIDVVKTRLDSNGDGIANDWTFAGSGSTGPFDDFDGDGILNYYEFRNGTNPTIFDLAPSFESVGVNQFLMTANQGDILLLESSTDFQNWSVETYRVAEEDNQSISFDTPDSNTRFYRVRKLN